MIFQDDRKHDWVVTRKAAVAAAAADGLTDGQKHVSGTVSLTSSPFNPTPTLPVITNNTFPRANYCTDFWEDGGRQSISSRLFPSRCQVALPRKRLQAEAAPKEPEHEQPESPFSYYYSQKNPTIMHLHLTGETIGQRCDCQEERDAEL